MFATLRSTIVEHGSTFDAGALAAAEAVEALCDLEVVVRIAEGMRAQAMKRVQDTNAHAGTAYPDAAKFISNKLGQRIGPVRDALDTASKLEDLPATSRAVREGRLTSAAARSIADAATLNPAAERDLLAAAEQGPTALSKAAIKARKAVESSEDRTERQRRSQYWKMWTDDDGMVAGKFRFTPEDGGIVEKLIEGLRQKLFRAHRAGKNHEPNEYCEIHGYLERDHMHDFALGGETSLANLIWLCYFHHRLKSRGWILGPPDPTTGKRKLFPRESQVA
jgi:hypothetical protein